MGVKDLRKQRENPPKSFAKSFPSNKYIKKGGKYLYTV